MLTIGLMSGTSADAVEAALVEIDERQWRASGRPTVRLRAYRQVPYPPAVQHKLLELADPQKARVDDLCRWNFALGEYFAQAVKDLLQQAGVSPQQVTVIGSHGQTVYHIPTPETVGDWQVRSTLQIGEPAVIAERTGITTVANFRVRDMAAGGQGAPLIAYVDALLYTDPHLTRVLQNLGGIGNATCLPAGGGPERVFAFDTGPGNMVIDGVVAELSQEALRYDEGGRWAAEGRPDKELVASLLEEDRYFAQPPPKTTGRERYGRPYAKQLIERVRQRGGLPADAVATATWLTAASLAHQYAHWILPRTGGRVDEVWISGGGSQNPTLLRMIREALAELGGAVHPAVGRVLVEGHGNPADGNCEEGRDARNGGGGGDVHHRGDDGEGGQPLAGKWPASAKEAVGFAILAAATWLGMPGNLPQVTGARHPVILGEIVPGAGRARPNGGGRGMMGSD
ncbi:MAG: anhydro-N-acetylmuramic acid kinase [Limnochordaceae bacterium]|nr:anhydro-N-acetylmuramic acid kinase [Limnochordaceae bacterium]